MFAYWTARKFTAVGRARVGVGVGVIVSSDEVLEAATMDDMAARHYSSYGADRRA